MAQHRLSGRGALLCLAILLLSPTTLRGLRLPAEARAAPRQAQISGRPTTPPQQTRGWEGVVPPALPTAVIAGLHDAPTHGYRDSQGWYHSALAPYSVRSHWRPSEVGGPDPVGRNDRFTAADGQRSIDLLAVPNPQHVDTARADGLLWAYLDQCGMQPHLLGRMRVLGAWVPLIGLTNLDTGQPHARLVFATAQHIWLMDLATWPRALPGDVHELAYVAGSFHLEAPSATAPGTPTGA